MPRIFLAFCLILSGAVNAAEVATPTSEDESFGLMMWRDFSSPVTTSAWIPLAAGSSLTLLTFNLRGKMGNPLQDAWADKKPLGKSAPVGDYLGRMIPNLVYFAGMYADYWWISKNKKSRDRALLMFKASAYSGAWTMLLKNAVRERRPNGSDRSSFPSGHAATSFAFAAVIGAEHEWYWSVPAYLMATFIGASRINDNMHRLHDVLAGATIGMSYGLGLYYRAHEHDPTPTTTVYQILPTDGLDGAILSLTHEF